jgi:hypothetical protein
VNTKGLPLAASVATLLGGCGDDDSNVKGGAASDLTRHADWTIGRRLGRRSADARSRQPLREFALARRALSPIVRGEHLLRDLRDARNQAEAVVRPGRSAALTPNDVPEREASLRLLDESAARERDALPAARVRRASVTSALGCDCARSSGASDRPRMDRSHTRRRRLAQRSRARG